MEITEVRIFPRESPDRKLKAYATVTFDNCFVVREVKVIEGNNGLFVAMPSQRIRESCPQCGRRNTVRSKFCSSCGASLESLLRARESATPETRQSEHRDIAHPITPQFREYLQKKVLEAYQAETSRAGVSYQPEAPQTEVPPPAETPPPSETPPPAETATPPPAPEKPIFEEEGPSLSEDTPPEEPPAEGEQQQT